MNVITGNLLDKNEKALYATASALAIITVVYNIVEGLLSIYFGISDETVALFGFGVDSFVEVISGIGIWHMISRLKRHGSARADHFESLALKITGTAFYFLAAGLAITAAVNIYIDHKPETTFWGIVIAVISIVVMWVMIHYKVKVGRQLNSPAIIADAACARACMYLSVVLLLSSAGYRLTGAGGFDSIGAVFIAVISVKEGREAFQKARGELCGCNDHCR